MLIRKICAVCLPLIVLANAGHAQETGCNSLSEFRQFDFWIGEWEVYDSASGNKVGENSISGREQDCVLLEQWRGASGSTGMSMNYYNPLTEEWRQVWVSAGRYAIDIVGGLRGSAMVLEGYLFDYQGESATFRGTWTPNDDGSVRQFFEQFNNDSQQWETWFDGRYVRKPDQRAAGQ